MAATSSSPDVHEPRAEPASAEAVVGGAGLVRPARLGELEVLVVERTLDRLADRARADREGVQRPRVAHGRVASQALDECAADVGVDGGDEPEPEAREARSQHRHGDHRPAQAALGRVLAHELAVRDGIRAADLEDLAAIRLVRPGPR